MQKMIGVFTAELGESYQAGVWRGIEYRARRRGYGVVTFLGSRVGSPIVAESTANVAYQVANPDIIEGLVIVSAAITTYLDADKLARAFESRSGIPTVSLGIHLPGAARIHVDSAPAVAEIVHHLVHAHGRKRIALINGPRDHGEVKARRKAFLEAAKRESIELDDRLDAAGTFSRASGMEAARTLLSAGVPFDAVFCMNDEMAIGAIEGLRDGGLQVPDDVSVTGFDGIEEGRSLIHPLTTIVQPLFELGATSVDTLCRLIAGGPVEDRVLTCSASIQESCGCPPLRRFVRGGGLPADVAPQEREAMASLIAHAVRGDDASFVTDLSRAVSTSILEGRDPLRWSDFLFFVQREAEAEVSAIGEGSRGRRRASAEHGKPAGGGSETLFESALAMVVDLAARVRYARKTSTEERFKTLRAKSASLAGSFELGAIFDQLEAVLEELEIGAGWVALFDRTAGSLEWSTLVAGPPGTPFPRGRFRTSELLPLEAGTDWRMRHWVLEPLVFQDEPLGYMLLPGEYDEPAVYDNLKEQISSALKGALLVEQVRMHERRLEAEVEKRTRELTRANAELKRENERRARLEQEVVEISNRTMERIGQDLHDDLCQHLAGIAMHASIVQDSLSREGRTEVDALRHIGELLSGSIARVKQIARGLIPAGLEDRGLTAAVEAMIQSARGSYPVTIDFRASPGFSLADTDRAFQVYRIVQEALSNALKHSGSSHIAVTLGFEDQRRAAEAPPAGVNEANGGMLVVEVSDSGYGLPERISPDGMGLRIMRYRAEKAGAELSLLRTNPGTRVTCRIPQRAKERK